MMAFTAACQIIENLDMPVQGTSRYTGRKTADRNLLRRGIYQL